MGTDRTDGPLRTTYPVEGGTTLAEAADAELLAAAARGDRDAFAVLYDRHSGPVYRFCLSRCGDREAAADACQETFIAVWSGARAYAGSGAVLAWILGIARRKVADQRRGAARRREADLADDEAVGADPGHAAGVEAAADMGAAMARLPESQQEAVVLTYGLGLSCQEAALVMGVPAGTVKSRLFAARTALAGLLAGRGEG